MKKHSTHLCLDETHLSSTLCLGTYHAPRPLISKRPAKGSVPNKTAHDQAASEQLDQAVWADPPLSRPMASPTFSKVSETLRKMSLLSSSKRARVSSSLRFKPSASESTSTRTWCWLDSTRFARSASWRSFCSACPSPAHVVGGCRVLGEQDRREHGRMSGHMAKAPSKVQVAANAALSVHSIWTVVDSKLPLTTCQPTEALC